MMVRGPMSATIATLMGAGLKPVDPTNWVTVDGKYVADIMYEPGISHHQIFHYIQSILENSSGT